MDRVSRSVYPAQAQFPTPSLYAKKYLYCCYAAGSMALPAGGTFVSPAERGIEVVYLESGSVSVSTKGAGSFLGDGMTFVADCEERPELTAVADSVLYFACADGANTRELYDFITSGGSSPFVANCDLRAYCGAIGEIMNNDPVGHDSEISAETHKLFCSLFDSALRRISGEKPQVARVREYIEKHYAEKLSLAKMARMANLSESDFGEAFRISTGFTPYDYLLTVRVTEGRRLLLETDLPLKEIAAKAGYSNLKSFSDMFTSKTGMPPSAFRRLFRKYTLINEVTNQ
ncbi:MAG: AraC family transcriptional regulator [Clostridia bacterium]|nr:AraC family transcriptional regulator [Clostridia bacterium]